MKEEKISIMPAVVIGRPYTKQEMRELMGKDGYIVGNIIVSFHEIIKYSLDNFLDLISIRLTGSNLLTDVDYEAVGVLNGGSGGSRIIIRVSGNVSEILSDETEKGYAIVDFNNTGMLEVQKSDAVDIFHTDEEAVRQAMKDGVKIIPVSELPEKFERRYLGWVDTPENRKMIEKHCERKAGTKKCPKCGGSEFIVTQHVTQTVVVDSEGNFLDSLSSCDEVTHKADDDDIWQCKDCGYDAAGYEFNVPR